jgi:hypothetical protein
MNLEPVNQTELTDKAPLQHNRKNGETHASSPNHEQTQSLIPSTTKQSKV